MGKTTKKSFKNNYLFFILLIFLILSKGVISAIDYNEIDNRSKSDFGSYQKISKTLIGQNTDITSRDWQYPPVYSILIIPTLFYDTEDYLILLNIVFSIIAMYFLYLFCNLFISKRLSAILSFIIVLIIPSFSIIKVGMPISLSSLLFIIFSYNLYKIKTNFVYCSISFILLVLTKYLFIALIPCIIYWIYINYDKKQIRISLTFFTIPIILISFWFLRNAITNGFTVIGILGGYYHIDLYISLIPSKIIFSMTDPQSIYILLIYLLYLITFLMCMINTKNINPKYINFCKCMLIYFIIMMILFGFLYERDGLRIRYFMYQTPILFMLICLNIKIIDEKNEKYK